MNTRCRSAGGLDPDVAPHVTSLPPPTKRLEGLAPACRADAVDHCISTPPPLMSRIFQLGKPGPFVHS